MAIPSRETRQKVRAMLAAGLTPRQIAHALDITTQAVYKHVNRLKEEQMDEATA